MMMSVPPSSSPAAAPACLWPFSQPLCSARPRTASVCCLGWCWGSEPRSPVPSSVSLLWGKETLLNNITQCLGLNDNNTKLQLCKCLLQKIHTALSLLELFGTTGKSYQITFNCQFSFFFLFLDILLFIIIIFPHLQWLLSLKV